MGLISLIPQAFLQHTHRIILLILCNRQKYLHLSHATYDVPPHEPCHLAVPVPEGAFRWGFDM